MARSKFSYLSFILLLCLSSLIFVSCGDAGIGKLNVARGDHAASILKDGRILVSGGRGDWGAGQRSSAFGTTEILDLNTNLWTLVSPLINPRYKHTQTLLDDGSLLVVGGSPNAVKDLTSELYNPANNTWTETSNMNYTRRQGHTATLLPNGEVLVTGGLAEIDGNKKIISKVEIYNPQNGSWRLVSDMTMAREKHKAILLTNGKVLVVGSDNEEQFIRGETTAELYDPTNDTWTDAGKLSDEHAEGFTAVLLSNDSVLISGGGTTGRRLTPETTATMEVYDTSDSTWSTVESMTTKSWIHTATLLNNGNILFIKPSSLEIYNTSSGTWTHIGLLPKKREGHTAVLLSDGRTLIIGGHIVAYGRSGGLSTMTAHDSVLVYDPTVEW